MRNDGNVASVISTSEQTIADDSTTELEWDAIKTDPMDIVNLANNEIVLPDWASHVQLSIGILIREDTVNDVRVRVDIDGDTIELARHNFDNDANFIVFSGALAATSVDGGESVKADIRHRTGSSLDSGNSSSQFLSVEVR